jgi:hypothetical protein
MAGAGVVPHQTPEVIMSIPRFIDIDSKRYLAQNQH